VTAQGTVAKRPEPRTVSVRGEGVWDGWEATARADFPARVLFALQSPRLEDVFGALDSIVITHNLPDENGELAGSMADVDPREGALAIAGLIFDAIGSLPNR
jgi:hypothetical protein